MANRSFIVYTLDFLSIPEYVIKKGKPHGHRYGKLPKEMHKKDFKGIHDRFLRDPDFRKSMLDMIEMNMFVVHGTFLQNKITPIECQNQDIFTRGKIGGSLSTIQETRHNQ